ncbi:hypothetical protein BHM03_00027712 [Ensete ventricosum]|nr:hypothetical protein BHM03_00027712 [Ensete ventricosum]
MITNYYFTEEVKKEKIAKSPSFLPSWGGWVRPTEVFTLQQRWRPQAPEELLPHPKSFSTKEGTGAAERRDHDLVGGHGHVGDARRPQTCCTRNAAGAVAGTRLIPYMSLYAETQPWNALCSPSHVLGQGLDEDRRTATVPTFLLFY